MANFKDRVEAEYEAIENTLSFLSEKPISQLSQLELAGLATLIHIIGIFAFIGLVTYWIMWFTVPQFIQSRMPDAPDYATYIAFEQAFPLEDGYVAVAALIGVIGLWQMKTWGFLSMLLGSGGVLFLGLMDLLYDLEHQMFIPFNAGSIIELLIVIFFLLLGSIVTTLLWKHRKKFLK